MIWYLAMALLSGMFAGVHIGAVLDRRRSTRRIVALEAQLDMATGIARALVENDPDQSAESDRRKGPWESEMRYRVRKLSEAINRSNAIVLEHGRNACTVFDNLRRLCEDVDSWSYHVEFAASQGARAEMGDNGDVVYRRS